MSENEEFVREFLEESAENLDQLDQDLVALEKQPRDKTRLESVFRTIHTIKGTSGFFGFSKLGALAHDGESLLGRVRDGELVLQQEIATALLELVDSIREMLANIQDAGDEGSGDYRDVSARLIRLASTPAELPAAAADQEAADQEAVDQEAADQEAVDQEAADQEAADQEAVDQNVEPRGSASSEDVEKTSAAVDSAAQPTVLADHPPPVCDPESGPEASPRPSTAAAFTTAGTEGSIRVDVGLLDHLMDLTGELVLARNRLNQFIAASDDRPLVNAIQRLSLITSGLQEGIIQTRMQSMSTIWGKLPRVIRDLAVACGKQVELDQEGEETELDRSLLEAIKDPLTHLIRNAVDHGIEEPEDRAASGKPRMGRVLLRAYHEGGQVHLEVSDDGRGIDVPRVRQRAVERGLIASEQAVTMSDQELVRLILEPGFSTAQQVSDVSGRGVGMDVVKTNVERIGGTIDIGNRPGLGSTIRITIPLTLAILPAMIVKQGRARYAIPQAGVIELLYYRGEAAEQVVEWVHDAPACRLRGDLLPLVYLNNVLRTAEESAGDRRVLNIAVVQAEGHRFGLVVDHVLNTEEVVVKPLGRCLGGIRAFAGATIMGDGGVALILDLAGVARESGITLAKSARPPAQASEHPPVTARFLVCHLGEPESDSFRRVAIPLGQVERLTEFARHQLELADGREVVQYGQQLLPLVRLAKILKLAPSLGDSTSIPVVVCRFGQEPIGLVVSRILDIVDHDPLRDQQLAGRGPVVCSCVMEGHVTDVVDPSRIWETAEVSLVDKLRKGREQSDA